MKMPKEKHKHKLTHLLKFIIFCIIMLAPFFAVLSKMIYVSCNKNAYQSYGITEEYTENNYLYETNVVDNYDNTTQANTLVNGNIYIIEFTINQDTTQENEATATIFTTGQFYYKEIETTGSCYVKVNTNNNGQIATRLEYRKYYKNSNTTILYGYYGNTFSIVSNTGTGTAGYRLCTIRMVISITNWSNVNLDYEHIKFYQCPENKIPFTTTTYEKTTTLDNAFYYSIEQIKQENTFNWVKNTGIYTVINGMNTNLGLTPNHILTYLLTYWALLTAIYIIFDIVIFTFEKITHFYE